MTTHPDILAVIEGRSQWTVITGDCLDILPTIPAGSVGAVVTDPPYGIGLAYAGYDDAPDKWRPLMNAVVPELKRVADFVVLPACDRMSIGWWYLNHNPSWMIAWHKGSPGHRSPIGFNDWEPMLAWGRPPVPMHDHFSTRCGFEIDGHPCPKPVAWASWLVERASSVGDVILDPFCGSGTTGVAAVQLGRRFVGIELTEKYAATARRRIANAAPLFVPPPPPPPPDPELYQ